MPLLGPGSALVRIAGSREGDAAGWGFICRHQGGDSLIVTSRKVFDLALGVAGRDTDGRRDVWIDGKFEAAPVFEAARDDGNELAVLRCTAAALMDRSVLHPFRQGLPKGDARIFSYHASRSAKAWLHPYKLRSSIRAAIRLSNEGPDQEHRIATEHYGSPVLDESDRVIAVVTGLDGTTSALSSDSQAIIVAGRVDQLMQWEDRPADLFGAREVFISYAREDGDLVGQVAAGLRRRGFRVWIDVRAIAPGDNWVLKLQTILQSVPLALVFCSPASRSSEWVALETQLLLTRLSSPGAPLVLPVILKGGEPPFLLGAVQAINLEDGNASGCVDEVSRALARHEMPRGAKPARVIATSASA
jgi:hypothetical protein